MDEGCLIAGVSLSGKTLADLSLELMRDTVSAIDVGRVSDPMAIYAPVPTQLRPDAGSGGHAADRRQHLRAGVRAVPEDPPEVWRERILAAFASIIPGLYDHLLFVEMSPVPAIGAWMGKSNNAAICNGQFPGQVGRDRLPVETPIPGLVLCGDGAGGRGIGTELAACSALEAVRARGPRPYVREAREAA